VVICLEQGANDLHIV